MASEALEASEVVSPSLSDGMCQGLGHQQANRHAELAMTDANGMREICYVTADIGRSCNPALKQFRGIVYPT